MNKDLIIERLSLIPFGSKEWMRSNDVECQECGKSDKMGILFTDKGGVAKCMRCDIKAPLSKFLKDIGHDDLADHERNISTIGELPSIDRINEEVIKETKESRKPLGYRRIEDSEYLNSRKFNQYHYKLFEPGKASFEPNLTKDHIVFLIYQNKILRGWQARSTKDKEWHDENLRLVKEGKVRLVLRWVNDPSASFSDLLGGYDEITDNTTSVILVEGLSDKFSVDTELGLNEQEEIKCLCTFGGSVSDNQLQLLNQRNIKSVVLMYDYGTIKKSKSMGLKLSESFQTFVTEIDEDTDPGKMNTNELTNIIIEAKDAFTFYFTNF